LTDAEALIRILQKRGELNADRLPQAFIDAAEKLNAVGITMVF
jgi:hypothetical protein